MANAQKITEIIDEKAFKDWERFVESLVVGQTNMAKVISEANELNKTLGSANTMGQFSKDAEKAALALEKVKQAQLKTELASQRVAQAQMRTIEMTERKAKAEAKAAEQEERFARAREEAAKRMEKNAKDVSDSIQTSNQGIAKSQKQVEESLKNSEAAAISASSSTVEASKKVKAAVEQEAHAYSDYRASMQRVIMLNMELKGELKQVRDEYKSYGDSIRPEKVVQFEKTIAELNSQIQLNNAEIRRFARENISAQGSMDALEAQLNSLRSAYKALSDEERENINVGGALLAHIQELDEEFKKQKKSIGQAQDEVGNYALIWDSLPGPLRGAIDLLGEANTEIDDTGVKANKFSAKGMIDGLKGLVAQAWAFITTPLGAAIAAISVAVMGAKAWYDYNKGLVEATRLTQQLTGETGDAAKEIRNAALATSEAFDKDFSETLKSANALAKEYGISMGQSMELINTGFIKGADASGQMLDNIREYAPQARSAGLSARELMGVLITAEKEGIFGDKGIDAIKEGTLRLREMTKSTREALSGLGIDADKLQKDLLAGNITMFQAIQKVSQKMSEFSENSQEVGMTLADVFAGPGEDAGLRYLKLLGEINLEQVTSLDNLTDIERAQMMQLKATEELNNEWAALFDTTGGGFELMVANIKVMVTDWLVKLLKGTRSLINYFIELYNNTLIFRGAVQAVGLSFSNLYTVIKTVFGYLIDNIKDFGSLMKAILTGNFTEIPNIIKGAAVRTIKEIKGLGSELGSNFINAFNNTIKKGNIGLLDDLTTPTGALDNTVDQVAGGTSGTIGDKDAAKKDRDKAIKDAIKARKTLNNRLIELGKERLLAEKRTSDQLSEYNKKIIDDEFNAFSDRFTNLDDYNKNRSRSIQLQNDIEVQEIKKMRADALEIQSEGKTEEYEAILKIIDLKEAEIKSKTIQAQQSLNDEVKKTAIELLRDRYASEATLSIELLDERVRQEQLILAERYRSGELNEREYQEARLKIQNEVNSEYIKSEIDQLEAIIELAKEKNLDTRSMENDLAKLKIDLSKEATDQQIDDIERLIEKEKEAAKARRDLYEEIGNAAFELLDSIFERQLADTESEIKRTEEDKQREIDRINTSTANEEQKAARLFAIESQFAEKERQLEEKRKQQELKRAKFQKAQNILQIISSTATGIARAFADFPFPAAVPIAAAVGALGAIQLATVLSQPLPKYFTGTDSSKEGWAHIGEKGRELMITPDGQLAMSPDTDTLAYLQKGTKIYNAQETKKILRGKDDMGQVPMDIRRLELAQKNGTKAIVKAIGTKSQPTTLITKAGWAKTQKGNSKFMKYLKRNGML